MQELVNEALNEGAIDLEEDFQDTGPPSKKDKNTQRRCLVSHERKAPEKMIRFVIGPDGQLVPDLKMTLPGRGMWLSCDAQSIKTAHKKNLFSRAARRKVDVESELDKQVEHLLVKSCIELLSLARRAGEAVWGFDKTRVAVKKSRPGLLLAARDGAKDGRSKIRNLRPECPEYAVLNMDELGQAFGRDRTVHAIITPGGLAEKLSLELERLKGLRQSIGACDGEKLEI